jgi:hypothetical protein
MFAIVLISRVHVDSHCKTHYWQGERREPQCVLNAPWHFPAIGTFTGKPADTTEENPSRDINSLSYGPKYLPPQ